MADKTNNYACKKIHEILQERDHFQQIDHHSYRQHARLGTWRDVNSSDIKIFIAHLLVMSSSSQNSSPQLLVNQNIIQYTIFWPIYWEE